MTKPSDEEDADLEDDSDDDNLLDDNEDVDEDLKNHGIDPNVPEASNNSTMNLV